MKQEAGKGVGLQEFGKPVDREPFVRPTHFIVMRHSQAWRNKLDGKLEVLTPFELKLLRDPQLTKLGEAQARRVGEYFSAQGVTFSRIIVTDLRRSVHTGTIIRGTMGLPVPVETEERFRETFNGCSASLHGREANFRRDGLYGLLSSLSDDERMVYTPDVEKGPVWTGVSVELKEKIRAGYETEEQVAKRQIKAMEDIADENPGETILVVGHSLSIAALLAWNKMQEREGLVRETRQQIYPHLTESVFDGVFPANTGYVDFEVSPDEKDKMQIRVADLHLEAVIE